MEEKFDDFEVKAPELSFGAAMDGKAETVEPEPLAVEKSEDKLIKDANLNNQQVEQINAFVDQIDLSNSNAIMNYGVGTQKKIADFSQRALDNVSSQDVGEAGQMIADLVTQLRNFDVDDNERGIGAFFKKKANKFNALRAKYSAVETNVGAIKKELEKRQVQLMKDTALLDKMYDMNLSYFQELTMYILAGKKKLQLVRDNDLAALQAKAQQSGKPEDAQASKDLASMCERFEKKLYDLELTRTIALQTAPQIRMVQSSDQVMAEKIQSTIVNTIPLWKNQMVIALGIEHSRQAAKAQREVTDMTNQLLRKNADSLKVATVETARESERGIVDIETLKHTNETLISTLDEVLQIQKDGKEKRAAAETELGNIENELKTKMLEAAQQARS